MLIQDKIKQIDKSDMLSLLKSFPEQIEESIKIADEISLSKKEYSNIIICGMGGSAIGGELLSELVKNNCPVPIFCCRDYILPKFANKNSLVICVSYSGNTEETLSCFSQAEGDIIGISSGGKLEQLCKERKLPFFKVPVVGIPPRSSLGFLFTIQYLILEKLGLAEAENLKEIACKLRELRELLIGEGSFSLKAALDLKDRFPFIYGQKFYIPVARRFQTQLNENAKTLARYDSFPECSHNDINAWGAMGENNIAVIILRDRDESMQMKKRIEFTKKNAFNKSEKVIEIFAEGRSDLEKMLHMIYTTDFVSYYLAILRGIDPTPVSIIEKLKKFLEE